MLQTKHTGAELLQDFHLGRGDAFTAIFRELYPSLCYYGFSIIHNKAAAEDIVGESFVKVWQRRTDFHSFPGLKSYLYTTVKNAAIDWIRKLGTEASALQEMHLLFEETAVGRFEKIIIAETFPELYDAIHELPAQCRNVITLSYLEGKNGKQVAAELDMDHGTVRSQKHRGITLLRKRLGHMLFL